ncbi:Flp family type IVb pilin [Nocardioides alcanivorans]|uniref:Flp family type IVb pilin n=1 Tax=Nocardioides alcanivorans TaxID=2897352 RepID=UPI001F440630|nr:Flp family type IVb pilin [Nocardioides alcanivorans]
MSPTNPTPSSRGSVATAAGSSDVGASAVEYALLVALIAAVIFAAVAALGGALPGLYESVCPAFGCGD